jgi:hypothetical protein
MGNDTLSTAKGTLYEATRLILGHRQQDYGSPLSNFQLIADFWNTYLDGRGVLYPSQKIGPQDVALMMDLLKTARAVSGNFCSPDSFVDKAGYSALAHGLAVETNLAPKWGGPEGLDTSNPDNEGSR